MRIGWIMGWAVPRQWFSAEVMKVLPEAEHVFFEPVSTALANLEAAGRFDGIVGYSLGAHLLLAEAVRVDQLGARVTLLAPFLAFPAEDGLGGRVSRTQVRYLARWVRRGRAAALADFYERAGMDAAPAMANDIADETLMDGLTRLESGRVEPPSVSDWGMYLGSEDGLLDAAILARHLPDLKTVDGGTHHPGALLRAWTEDAF